VLDGGVGCPGCQHVVQVEREMRDTIQAADGRPRGAHRFVEIDAVQEDRECRWLDPPPAPVLKSSVRARTALVVFPGPGIDTCAKQALRTRSRLVPPM